MNSPATDASPDLQGSLRLQEFSLIDSLFRGLGAERSDVLLGVGDDAALLQASESISTGCSVLAGLEKFSEAHTVAAFVEQAAAAATAAATENSTGKPAWATLSLSLPTIDTTALTAFASHLDEALRHHRIALVGGDTTRGAARAVLFVSAASESPAR